MARISDLTVNGDTHLLGKTYGTLSGNVVGHLDGRATNADLADEVKTTSTISGDKLPVLFKKYSDNKLYYQPEEELWYSPNSFVLHSHYFDGDLKGRADVATKADRLSTARTIALTGKASGSSSFDGSGNININVSNVNADSINGNIVLKYEQLNGESSPSVHAYVDGKLVAFKRQEIYTNFPDYAHAVHLVREGQLEYTANAPGYLHLYMNKGNSFHMNGFEYCYNGAASGTCIIPMDTGDHVSAWSKESHFIPLKKIS